MFNTQQGGIMVAIKKRIVTRDLSSLHDDALIDRREALALTQVTSRALKAGIKSGRYPQPIQVSPRVYRWRIGDIRDIARGKVVTNTAAGKQPVIGSEGCTA